MTAMFGGRVSFVDPESQHFLSGLLDAVHGRIERLMVAPGEEVDHTIHSIFIELGRLLHAQQIALVRCEGEAQQLTHLAPPFDGLAPSRLTGLSAALRDGETTFWARAGTGWVQLDAAAAEVEAVALPLHTGAADTTGLLVTFEHPAPRPAEVVLLHVGVVGNAVRGVLLRRQSELRCRAELTRVQGELQQAQRLEAMGRLASGVAHDFNNLLTVILAVTEHVVTQVHDDTLATELKDVIDAGRRAAELTRQLLAFSRQQPRAPRVLDLCGLLRDTEKLLRRVLREDIVLVFTQPDRELKVRADPSQLSQVILNLAVNARDAMPRGGRLEISLGTRTLSADTPSARALKPGTYVELSVRDDGDGISAENLEHVFEPFFTTKDPGHGTGLGLSTVLGVVKQSDGDVHIESAVGRGTCVTVRLPAVDDTVPHPDAARRTASGKGELVLLAEDDVAVRKVLFRMLTGLGYQVLQASNGAEALERAAGRHIDLLISDVVMPLMSGLELARLLRERQPGVRVLFTSGFSDVPASELERYSRQPLLAKPFLPEEVSQAVGAALGQPTM